MATRFLLPSSLAPAALAPAFDVGWEVTTSANRRRMTPVSQATASEIHTTGTANGINPNDVLAAQFVSDQLAAQTVSGSVKGQIRCNEGSATLEARSQISIRVIAPDLSVRGTLLALDTSALSSEWATSLTNRKEPLAAVSPVTLAGFAILGGDRIVAEIGFRAHSTVANVGGIAFRDNGADLAENETDTASGNTWLEFSQTLVFQTGGGMLMGVG